MSKLIGLIMNNPMVLVYLAAACFLAGLAAGAVPAWKYQGALKDAVQSQFDSFVGQQKTIGEQAAKEAADKDAEYKRLKEKYDEQQKNDAARIAALGKLRHDARARQGYLPPASAGSSNPQRVCFDRAKLESALRRLDERVSGFIGQGSTAIVNLNIAKEWAQDVLKVSCSP
jgi:capsule polysaccharide export protein KpsE/RkpR